MTFGSVTCFFYCCSIAVVPIFPCCSSLPPPHSHSQSPPCCPRPWIIYMCSLTRSFSFYPTVSASPRPPFWSPSVYSLCHQGLEQCQNYIHRNTTNICQKNKWTFFDSTFQNLPFILHLGLPSLISFLFKAFFLNNEIYVLIFTALCVF